MAIKKEDKERLIALGFNFDELEAAIKADAETAITIPTGNIFTDETIAARDANKIAEGKALGVIEGKSAGFEIVNKALIEKYGLKEVKKTDEPNKVIEAIQSVVGKGDEILSGQVKALQQDNATLLQKIETIEGEKKVFERNTTLLSMLPQNRSKTLSDSEYLTLIGNSIEEVDGKLAVKLNGTVLRENGTQNILPLDKGLEQLFKSRTGWLSEEQQQGGRGAGDGHGGQKGAFKTLTSATEAYVKEHGEGSLVTPEYRAHIAKLAEDPNFDLDN